MHFVPVELFILEIKNKWKFLWLTLVGPQNMADFEVWFPVGRKKVGFV